MISVRLDMRALGAMADASERLENALGRDKGELLSLIGAYMQGEIVDSFLQMKDPVTGAAWAPLSSFTNSVEGRGQGAKPLQDTNTLQRAVLAMLPQISGDTVELSLGGPHPGGSFSLGDIAALHNGDITGPPRGSVTIRAKNAEFLYLPKSREAQRYAGNVRRFFAVNGDKVERRINGARTSGVVVEGSGSQEIVHYVLVKEVTIPTRRFIGIGDKQERELRALIDDVIREAIEGPAVAAGGAP